MCVSVYRGGMVVSAVVVLSVLGWCVYRGGGLAVMWMYARVGIYASRWVAFMGRVDGDLWPVCGGEIVVNPWSRQGRWG